MSNPRFVAFAFLISLLGAAAARASPPPPPPPPPTDLMASEDVKLFGSLKGSDTGCKVAPCGPTSVVNGLVFLEHKWPDKYGHGLFPDVPDEYDSWIAAANILGSASYMGDCSCGAVTTDYFAYGKHKYIEEKLPGKTTYAVQTKLGWGVTAGGKPVPKPAYFMDVTPSPEFLSSELKSNEALEILLSFADKTGHYVTVTGIDYKLTPGGGSGTLNYIDPADGKPHSFDISQSASGGLMSGLWSDPNDLDHKLQSFDITFAEGESPAPEPAGWLLMLLGFGTLGVAARARRRLAESCNGISIA